MFEERLVLRVGAIVSLILVIGVVAALQVNFRDLGPTAKVAVLLSHPGPLRADADVQLGGRKIGTVHAIRLVTSNEARHPEHPLYPDGGVLCEVWIRKRYLPWVRLNSELFVNARGLIGESYLEVAPPPGDQEMLRPLRSGDQVRGIDPARMEHIIIASFENARRFGKLLEELRPSSELLRDEIEILRITLRKLQPDPNSFDSFVASLDRASSELATLQKGFEPGSLAQIQAHSQRLFRQARQDLELVDSALGQLDTELAAVQRQLPPDLAAKFHKLADDAQVQLATLRRAVATLRDLAKRVESGSGTIGALINDPEFSDDAKKLGRYLKRHPWKLLTRPPD